MSIWIVDNELLSSSDPVEEIIKARGHDPQEFLNPSFNQLHPPILMKGMAEAVARVMLAIKNMEKVRVIGDYDADGISSTYVMVRLLKEASVDVSYDIPDRKAGYGLSDDLIDVAVKDGCSLIITCDNGIAAGEQVAYGQIRYDMDFIITDHHEPQDVIPNCIVINPKQQDCLYPFKELAGVGVAWKFCQTVLEAANPGDRMKSLDVLEIVALGTIADVVTLTGENRVIAAVGLSRFKDTKIIGLKFLLDALGLQGKHITSTHVGFTIGPAFNATGRLVSAKEAVDMLLAKSPIIAKRLANYIGELNNERKEWTEKYSKKIMDELDSKQAAGTLDSVIVHYDHNIPEGIMGIVASRIKEKYYRPILLCTVNEDATGLKGSGRSIAEYNMFEHLMAHRAYFESVGGHRMACGFTLKSGMFGKLNEILNEDHFLSQDDLTPKLMIDYSVEPELMTIEMADQLERLKPFGKGNPKPLFTMDKMQLIDIKFMGAEKNHVKFTLSKGVEIYEAIGFGMADKYAEAQQEHMNRNVTTGIFLDIAFYPGVNEWKNNRTLQFELSDFKLSSRG
jgi:single-stranded-DNA-specific exonuclease